MKFLANKKTSDVADITPPVIPPIRSQFLDDSGGVAVGDNAGVGVCTGMGVRASVSIGVGLDSGVGAGVCVGVNISVDVGVGVGVGMSVGIGDGADPDPVEDGSTSRTASINRPESKKRSSWSATINSKVWLPAVVIRYEKS